MVEIDVLTAAPRLARLPEERGKYPSLHPHDGRSPSSPRRRFVLEAGDILSAREQAPDLRALDALAAPVSETHGADAEANTFVEILGHDGHDVTRSEGVEVELAGDGKDDGLPVLGWSVFVGQRVTRTSKDPELSA